MKDNYVTKKRAIYIILMATVGSVYVGDVTTDDYRSMRSKHRHGKHSMTRDAMERCIAAGDRPQMYEMLAVDGTSSDVLTAKIALMRWAVDHGMTVLASDRVLQLVAACTVDTNRYYATIVNMTWDQLIADKPDLYANYRTADLRRRRPEDWAPDKTYHISADVSGTIYRQIAAEAAAHKVSMAQYIRDCIVTGGGWTVDMSPLVALVDQLVDCAAKVAALRDTVVDCGADTQIVAQLQIVKSDYDACCRDVLTAIRALAKGIKQMRSGVG